MEITTGDLLRQARLRRGLTARELTILSGVPQSTVSRIEAGKMSPSYDIMRKLLAALSFEASDSLRPAVTDGQLVRFMDEYADGAIPARAVPDRLRIAAQTAPVMGRAGVRRASASLAEVVGWAAAQRVSYAVSGLEACSDETSFEPIVYLAPTAALPFDPPQPGRRGSILLPLADRHLRFVGDAGGVPVMPFAWALMDAIASPGRQSDVALDLLDQYAAASRTASAA